VIILGVMAASGIGGCTSAPKAKQTVLPVPSSTSAAAARHNNEGIHAYQLGQGEGAKQHFEAAIAASPERAEAHYNLGKTGYRLGTMRQGDTHFIEAANLAPGNKVTWNSPPSAMWRFRRET
jgi:Flp pilus assembly protein TadD